MRQGPETARCGTGGVRLARLARCVTGLAGLGETSPRKEANDRRWSRTSRTQRNMSSARDLEWMLRESVLIFSQPDSQR